MQNGTSPGKENIPFFFSPELPEFSRKLVVKVSKALQDNRFFRRGFAFLEKLAYNKIVTRKLDR